MTTRQQCTSRISGWHGEWKMWNTLSSSFVIFYHADDCRPPDVCPSSPPKASVTGSLSYTPTQDAGSQRTDHDDDHNDNHAVTSSPSMGGEDPGTRSRMFEGRTSGERDPQQSRCEENRTAPSDPSLASRVETRHTDHTTPQEDHGRGRGLTGAEDDDEESVGCGRVGASRCGDVAERYVGHSLPAERQATLQRNPTPFASAAPLHIQPDRNPVRRHKRSIGTLPFTAIERYGRWG